MLPRRYTRRGPEADTISLDRTLPYHAWIEGELPSKKSEDTDDRPFHGASIQDALAGNDIGALAASNPSAADSSTWGDYSTYYAKNTQRSIGTRARHAGVADPDYDTKSHELPTLGSTAVSLCPEQ